MVLVSGRSFPKEKHQKQENLWFVTSTVNTLVREKSVGLIVGHRKQKEKIKYKSIQLRISKPYKCFRIFKINATLANSHVK